MDSSDLQRHRGSIYESWNSGYRELIRSQASFRTDGEGATDMRAKLRRIGQVMRVNYDCTTRNFRVPDPRISFVSLSAWISGASTSNQGAIAVIYLGPTPDRFAMPSDQEAADLRPEHGYWLGYVNNAREHFWSLRGIWISVGDRLISAIMFKPRTTKYGVEIVPIAELCT